MGFTHWFQRRMNERTVNKIRRKGGKFMGMDMLILHTAGRRTGESRETPLSWFADGEDGWLLVASGGGRSHPDWYLNLTTHPDQASVEWGDDERMKVTPHVLGAAEREPAWQRITTAQPRYAKYQSKSDREYPVIRLSER